MDKIEKANQLDKFEKDSQNWKKFGKLEKKIIKLKNWKKSQNWKNWKKDYKIENKKWKKEQIN